MLNTSFLSGGHRVPIYLQTEATECGITCLAMVATFYGFNIDVASVRQRFSVSLNGSTLADLIEFAQRLQLDSRPLRLELQDLDALNLPCIAHWDLTHFVVITETSKTHITIHDPAFGRRRLTLAEVSSRFTGVALELWPTAAFVEKTEHRQLRLTQLFGATYGLAPSLALILCVASVLELISVIFPFYLQWIVDNVVVSADINLLITLGVAFGVLSIWQQVLTALRSWMIVSLGTTITLQWYSNVFSHLISLPLEYFVKRHIGDIVSRFGSLDTIQQTVSASFIEAIIDGLMALVALGLMLLYSPSLALICVIAMLFYAAMRAIFYPAQRSATEESIVHNARQQTHFLETVRGVRAIKLFNLKALRHRAWVALLVNQLNASIKLKKLNILYKAGDGGLFGLENVLVVGLGAEIVIQGGFSIGALIAFLAYKGQFETRVASLIDSYFQLRMLGLQAERVADIVLTEAEANVLPQHKVEFSSSPAITFDNVCFRYAERDPKILSGLSLRVPPGQAIAITGPSGCGKTTLLQLLMGLHQPTSGRILVNDIPMSTIGQVTMRSIIGAVLQDDVLFTGSIADNISFFDEKPDTEWMIQCAKVACIHLDIIALPMGYSSLVGDMGTALSGGQKQRITIARALYKRPLLLVLDEATSHLDADRELEISKAISEMRITRIMVAHRAETIRTAERLVVLNQGLVEIDRPLDGNEYDALQIN